jgi:phosphatidate phosphatase APP1
MHKPVTFFATSEVDTEVDTEVTSEVDTEVTSEVDTECDTEVIQGIIGRYLDLTMNGGWRVAKSVFFWSNSPFHTHY